MLLENLRRAHGAITRYMLAGSDPDLPIVLAYVDMRQSSLVVGIDHRARLPLDRYRERLRPLVETLPLRLQAMSTARHSASRPKEEARNPIMGGIQMAANVNQTPVAGTITVVGVLDGQLGMIVSGHTVTQKNKAVYQPAPPAANNVGKVTIISNWQSGNCDAAWAVYANAARTQPTPGEIFLTPSTTYKVTGTKSSALSNLGDQVVMQGAITADESPGRIEGLNVTVNVLAGKFDPAQTLTNQVLTNYKSQSGDSGAPVFEKVKDDNVTFLGINVGEATKSDVTSWGAGPFSDLSHYGIYSPWETIQSALGAIDVAYPTK